LLNYTPKSDTLRARFILLVTFCVLALLCQFTAKAQTGPATQFFSTPTVFNLAATGFIPGDMRAAVNYGQTLYNWYTTRTVNASLDMPLLRGMLPQGDALGVGLLYNQTSYGYRTWNSASAASLAYHKAIGKRKRQHLSLGGQAVFNVITYSSLSSTGSIEETKSKSYGSHNVRVQYSIAASDRADFYLGYTNYNLSKAYATVGNGTELSISDGSLFSFGSHIKLSNRVSVFANALYEQPYSRLIAGGYGRFSFNKPLGTALYVGGWASRDFLRPYLGIEVRKCRFGASYDCYLPDVQGEGSFEVSLVYSGVFHKAAPGARPNMWRAPAMF
jgi:hypothetical protein